MMEDKTKKDVLVVIGIFLIILLFLIMPKYFRNNNNQEEEKEVITTPIKENKKEETQTNRPKNNDYPNSYVPEYSEDYVDIYKKLSSSKLRNCSYYIKGDGYSNFVMTWNLLDESEIYRCSISWNKDIRNQEISCEEGDALLRYVNGEKELIRFYALPDGEYDSFVNIFSPSASDKVLDNAYYKYDIGPYTDVIYKDNNGEDYFIYYWYQKTDDGPLLIYEAEADSHGVISGKKHNLEFWDSLDGNINKFNIIRYNDFERETDYYYIYEKIVNKRREENKYSCLIDGEYYSNFDDYYYDWYGFFDSEDDAWDEWDSYCQEP